LKRDSSHPSQFADPHAVALTILDAKERLCDAWGDAIVAQTGSDPAQVAPGLEAFLTGLAHYVAQPQRRFPADAAMLWRQTVPSDIEGVTLTALAMGLLGDVLRRGLADQTDPAAAEAAVGMVCRQLPDYSAEFVRGLMTSADLSPSEQHWYEVSRELAEERDRRITELGILNEVATALSSTLSPNDLYHIIYEQCSRLVDARHFYIGTVGPEPDDLTLAVYYANGERRPESEGLVVRIGLTTLVLEAGKPLIIDDYLATSLERGFAVIPIVHDGVRYAWLGAPIISGSRPIGILAVMSPEGKFSQDDADILAAVARQAGAAIENARLYAAQIHQANQLRALNQLSRSMATIREPQALMRQASSLIREMFGYSVVSIFVAHPSYDDLMLRTIQGLPDERLVGLSLPIDGPGLVSTAARTRQPVLSNDVLADPRYLAVAEAPDSRSELSIPLLRDDVLLGVLDVQAPVTSAFSTDDIELLETVADQLAIALENADLFLQERKRRTELALILEAAQAANSSLVLDDVLQRVAEGIADAIGLPSCVVYLYDEEGDRLLPSAFVAREGSLLDTARFSQVIPSTDASQLLRRIYLAGHEASAIEMLDCAVNDELSRLLCPSAVLAVPFVVKQQFLGLALVVSHDDEYHFSPHQLRVAYGIAGAAALALENARLYARSHSLGIAEERIRIAREIHDGIAQRLAAISLQLEATEQMFRSKPDKAQAKLGRALELTREALNDARRSVIDLHASALQELSLAEALERRTQQFVEEYPAGTLTGSFDGDRMYGRLSSRIELGLFRIFEEALQNIAQHAEATHIDVLLARDGDDVTLSVSDNGSGFDVDTVLAGNQALGKFGLVAIRERVRLMHGNLKVQSSQATGTTLQVTVPFEPQVGDDPADAGAIEERGEMDRDIALLADGPP
jgi:two-component system NarL family sensor kinase